MGAPFQLLELPPRQEPVAKHCAPCPTRRGSAPAPGWGVLQALFRLGAPSPVNKLWLALAYL